MWLKWCFEWWSDDYLIVGEFFIDIIVGVIDEFYCYVLWYEGVEILFSSIGEGEVDGVIRKIFVLGGNCYMVI